MLPLMVGDVRKEVKDGASGLQRRDQFSCTSSGRGESPLVAIIVLICQAEAG